MCMCVCMRVRQLFCQHTEERLDFCNKRGECTQIGSVFLALNGYGSTASTNSQRRGVCLWVKKTVVVIGGLLFCTPHHFSWCLHLKDATEQLTDAEVLREEALASCRRCTECGLSQQQKVLCRTCQSRCLTAMHCVNYSSDGNEYDFPSQKSASCH